MGRHAKITSGEAVVAINCPTNPAALTIFQLGHSEMSPQLTVDQRLALKRASSERGFRPLGYQARAVVYSLEVLGFLRKSPTDEIWFITGTGLTTLASQDTMLLTIPNA